MARSFNKGQKSQQTATRKATGKPRNFLLGLSPHYLATRKRKSNNGGDKLWRTMKNVKRNYNKEHRFTAVHKTFTAKPDLIATIFIIFRT